MLAAVGLCSQAWSAEPSPADGGQLFERRCGVCHLKGQTGTNMLERRLGAQRALLAERTDLTPEYIRFVVRQGLVNMPRLTRVELPDAELEAISAWLRRPRH
jgi:mono/diheme cytochrome c family protein